ncbi:DUF1344 domain-containing protein [Rhizobium sp. L1K21]|uniref:DUF1344 domain-containing protein n=1 Tax=Rhizobium sp. L1K21 TaxID=2954933 RepID=UPI002093FFE6|nr:DUF1344 domain-containing protein [Rhizobium sp. L1K21]MCO6186752.1 DUF1344 domain-containing protein [Rhizobium sp. L1K21]
MRALLFSTITAASVLAFGAAMAAAPQSIDGKIKHLTSKTLTLADGSSYMLPKNFSAKGLKAGEKVHVAFDVMNKKNEATSVTVVK